MKAPKSLTYHPKLLILPFKGALIDPFKAFWNPRGLAGNAVKKGLALVASTAS